MQVHVVTDTDTEKETDILQEQAVAVARSAAVKGELSTFLSF